MGRARGGACSDRGSGQSSVPSIICVTSVSAESQDSGDRGCVICLNRSPGGSYTCSDLVQLKAAAALGTADTGHSLWGDRAAPF